MKKYNIITLCGSARFKEAFERTNKESTLDGNIVISVGFFEQSGKTPFMRCLRISPQTFLATD